MTGAFAVDLPDGARLSGVSDGTGPALLLVSGLGGAAGFWAPAVPALAARFRVIRFDQRGIAGATRGTAAVDVDQLARDALAAADAAGADRFALLGHSTGGCIGQAVERMAPDRLDALILSASWPGRSRYMQALFASRLDMLRRDPGLYAAASALMSYAPEWLEDNWPAFDAAVAKAPTGDAVRVVEERIAALMAWDGAGAAPSTAPTLVLGAEDDMIVPAFLQRRLAAARPGSTLTMLPDGGHFYPVSRTGAFCAAIIDWLAGR